MKKILLSFVIFFSFVSNAQKKSIPLPDEIIIGNHSYIDVGPPDSYSIQRISRDGGGTLIEQVYMTPSYNSCHRYAAVNVTIKKSSIRYEGLLGSINPCSFSPKKIEHEAKRKSNMPNFAGTNSTLQFSCANETRILKVNQFESDIFNDPNANTPSFTSWFMKMTSKLNAETGTELWSNPIFILDPMSTQPVKPHDEPSILKDIASGKYDGIFVGGDLPSVMYRDAQETIGQPIIQLISSTPVMPQEMKMPYYPPIAKMASVDGHVVFDFKIGDDFKPTELRMKSGPKMLEQTSKDAISAWKYCSASNGQDVEVVIAFNLNCTKNTH